MTLCVNTTTNTARVVYCQTLKTLQNLWYSQASQISCLAMMQGPRWRYGKGELPPKTPFQILFVSFVGLWLKWKL